MQRLLLFGLNHTTAPLALRERIAFSSARQVEALDSLRDQFSACEFLLLSTCNRVEIYAARPTHGHPRMEELIAWMAGFHQVDAMELARHGYQKTQLDAVEHLFRVAGGLDSMVVGETEILGQLRNAYELAADQLAVGETLNPLLQRAMRAGRAVASASAEPPSVARSAVDYAWQAVGDFAEKTVLTIGAGDVATSVLRQVRPHRPRRLLVSNRDAARARRLADHTGAEALAFDRLPEGLAAADVVLTSTASPTPIITREAFPAQRQAARTLLIDLGVPRDIDPAVRMIDGVSLVDLDDIGTPAGGAETGPDTRAAEAIIRQHLDDYFAWQRAREYGPAIDALYRKYHELAEQELRRAVGGLNLTDMRDVERLREFSQRMVNKLLHDPVQALRQADAMQSPTHDYRAVMEKLFNLKLDRTDQS